MKASTYLTSPFMWQIGRLVPFFYSRSLFKSCRETQLYHPNSLWDFKYRCSDTKFSLV